MRFDPGIERVERVRILPFDSQAKRLTNERGHLRVLLLEERLVPGPRLGVVAALEPLLEGRVVRFRLRD